MVDPSLTEYRWGQAVPHTQAYMIQPLMRLLQQRVPQAHSIADLGCGNGALCAQLCYRGYQVIGLDPSACGIDAARQRCPEIDLIRCAATPDEVIALSLPPVDVVISTEVVEHCYAPREWAQAAYTLLKPGGVFIC